MRIDLPSSESQKILDFCEWVFSDLPDDYAELMDTIAKSKKGLTIEVDPLKVDRTRHQENYYRKWCREFANFCGMTPDEVHEEILCESFGSAYVNTAFGPRRRPMKRSCDTELADYSHLIDTLIRVAAEMGFDIPPPKRTVEVHDEQD